MTYPKSPPGGDKTLSKSHYHPKLPASSFVKEGSRHPSQGCCGDLGGNDLESAPSAVNPNQMDSISEFCRDLFPFGAQCILAAKVIGKSYFECLFLGRFPKCVSSLQLTSVKLASAEALLKASHFQWNDLGGRKEIGRMVTGETGSQRGPQAMESEI